MRVLVLCGLLTLAACNHKSGGGTTPPGTGLQHLAFETRTDVELNSFGLSQSIAPDLNDDGLVDLAVGSYGSRAILVAVGRPNGTFLALAPLPTPTYPLSIAAGDVGGDGRIDLVAACVREGPTSFPGVSVFEQDSTGAYTDSFSLSLPHNPGSIVIGSIDGVHEDMFVSIEEQREVWQLRVDAAHSINFVAAYTSAATGADGAPVTTALVDENGDGLLDLAVGERRVSGGAADRVVVFKNVGGVLGSPYVLAPFVAWPIVIAVDADGTSIPDLAIAQIEADDVIVYHGNAGGFGAGAPDVIAFGARQLGVGFGDFDGDGVRDAAASLFEEGAVALKNGSSGGAWGAARYYNIANGPRSVLPFQLPGDTKLDLAVSAFETVSVLRATGGGDFQAMQGFPIGDRPQYVRCADFDGDGNQDAVSVDQFQQEVVFQRGLGDGRFQFVAAVPLDPSSQETPGYMIVDDFDEDGLQDVITSVLESSELQLMRNQGGLPLSSLRVDRIPVGAEPRGLDAADLNDDGHLDVVVANSVDHTMQVLLGNGDGTFVSEVPVPLADRPLTVHVADLDGDGLEDLALAVGELDGSGAKLMCWRGDGAGHFALVTSSNLDSTALVMSSGDFDENGAVDLALSQFGYPSDKVYVFRNGGAFQFKQSKIQVGNNPGTLEVADVDLDGHDDLIVPLGIGRLRVLLGNGKGGFQTTSPKFALDLPAPFSTNALAFVDLNGDDLADFLFVAPESRHLWSSLNQSH
ncbi:MAG: VCBS repeat-containing protein [Planctomycetes bacterium]|nr:VCBS repeat-containing protein [Planctomycetota bacterium]